MVTSFSTTTTNPLIAALENAFAEATQPIEWLVITQNDSRMLRSLAPALPRGSAAYLEVPQDAWDFEGKHLPETIEWAFQQADIKHLVLMGNSHAERSPSQASAHSSRANAVREAGRGKLLAGVQLSTARGRDNQMQFATHIHRMLRIPILNSRWSGGELAVYGLFYRAEVGLFLAYDVNADAFRPLAA